jgi:hypothetical protein
MHGRQVGGGAPRLPFLCSPASPSTPPVPSSRSYQPRNVDHDETTVVIARPWWRVLVGGKIGGALRIVQECRFLGFMRNACRFGTDAVAPVGVAVLPEGRRVYLFSTSRCVPGGNPRSFWAAATSSSFSFLEVLLGTRCFGGCSGCELSSFSSSHQCRLWFLFFFFFCFVWV